VEAAGSGSRAPCQRNGLLPKPLLASKVDIQHQEAAPGGNANVAAAAEPSPDGLGVCCGALWPFINRRMLASARTFRPATIAGAGLRDRVDRQNAKAMVSRVGECGRECVIHRRAPPQAGRRPCGEHERSSPRGLRYRDGWQGGGGAVSGPQVPPPPRTAALACKRGRAPLA